MIGMRYYFVWSMEANIDTVRYGTGTVMMYCGVQRHGGSGMGNQYGDTWYLEPGRISIPVRVPYLVQYK